MSGLSYFLNQAISEAKYKWLKEFDFEQPLTRLIWIASILCITTSFGMSKLLIGDITVNGKVTATGDVKGQGTSLHTHVHSGVQSGGSNTGGPV